MSDEVFRGVKFNRKITWDKDVMKVTDSVSDVYKDVVKKMSDDLNEKTEAEVLRHFEIDMSELREFLRYKEVGITIPQWKPVTPKTMPEDGQEVVAHVKYDGGYNEVCVFFKEKEQWWGAEGWYSNKAIIRWFPIPIPLKG